MLQREPEFHLLSNRSDLPARVQQNVWHDISESDVSDSAATLSDCSSFFLRAFLFSIICDGETLMTARAEDVGGHCHIVQRALPASWLSHILGQNLSFLMQEINRVQPSPLELQVSSVIFDLCRRIMFHWFVPALNTSHSISSVHHVDTWTPENILDGVFSQPAFGQRSSADVFNNAVPLYYEAFEYTRNSTGCFLKSCRIVPVSKRHIRAEHWVRVVLKRHDCLVPYHRNCPPSCSADLHGTEPHTNHINVIIWLFFWFKKMSKIVIWQLISIFFIFLSWF